jgi:hypothetical protein
MDSSMDVNREGGQTRSILLGEIACRHYDAWLGDYRQ